MSAFREESDSDLESDDGAVVTPEDVGGDDLLSLNSVMFHRDDWKFIEQDKTNVDLILKLAADGARVNEPKAEEFQKVMAEEEYLFMKGYMLEKHRSVLSKYLTIEVPARAAAHRPPATRSKAEQIKMENNKRFLKADVDSFTLNVKDGSVYQRNTTTRPTSLLVYLVYWALHMVHILKGKRINDELVPVTAKTAIDCLMSLYRCSKEMAPIVCPSLLVDAKMADDLLLKQLKKSYGEDLMGVLFLDGPQLVSDTFYDLVKPKGIKMYEEQEQVIKLIDNSLSSNKALLVGYQVPPSGGKTILSVAIAALLARKYRTKKVLYVCYNSLVRIAVANACAQAVIPFWVASTRKVQGKDKTAIRPSNSCLNMSKQARRARWLQAKNVGFKNKEYSVEEALAKAQLLTVNHCPIIISDLATAALLLELCPDDYVAYIDEPTAGAERGLENNLITAQVADICLRLPAQAVLLSATLPDIPTELPTLATSFVAGHGGIANARVEMVTSLRLPVGCDALDPAGNLKLPHQLAENFNEFKLVVSRMHGDALMQRFYTPLSVRTMYHDIVAALQAASGAASQALPAELLFESVVPHLGALKHASIRTYAQNLLEWVASMNLESVFERIKTGTVPDDAPVPIPVTAETLLSHHCSDGRALAVASTRKIIPDRPITAANAPAPAEQYLDVVVKLAMERYFASMPDLEAVMTTFRRELEEWNARLLSLRSRTIPRNQAARLAHEAELVEHERNKPTFQWPLKIQNRGAPLTSQQADEVSPEIAAYLLSGVGIYDPGSMTYPETVAVMSEAAAGNLACLFASPFIVYGTNIDLSTVFVGSSYSHKATRNALYQLIGRAGRTGKSHRAKVLFQDYDALRKAMIPARENVEATIIEHHLQQKVR